MKDPYYVTAEGYDQLQQECKRLLALLEETQRQMGREASIDNDLRENPEFMELRRRATYTIPQQLAEIERVLSNCVIVPRTTLAQIDVSEVRFGTRVVLEGDGEVLSYEIVGYGESDPRAGRISYLTPLAGTLLGLTVGAAVNLPGSRSTRELTIIAIERLFDDSGPTNAGGS